MKRLLLLFLLFMQHQAMAVTCSPTTISVATTISTPGAYILTKDISNAGGGSPKAIIVIATSDVDLDLGGFRLVSTAGNTTNGIYIKPGLSNINIHGGLISTMGLAGIAVDGGCSSIQFNNVTSVGCKVFGFQLGGIATVNPLTNSTAISQILFEQCSTYTCGGLTTSPVIDLGGLSSNNVNNLVVQNCNFDAAASAQSAGIALNTCTSSLFQNCSCNNNVGTTSSKGISLVSCKDNNFENCKSLANAGNNVFGFVTAGGSNNRFIRCTAEDLISNSLSQTNVAVGFDIQTTEAKSAIVGCTANNISALAGTPYGIRTLLNVTSLNSVSDKADATNQATVNSVAWSPNGQFVAVAGVSTTGVAVGIQIRIYEFDTNLKTLILRDSQTYAGTQINSIDWSTDGQYLATGGSTGTASEINIYQLNSTSKTISLVALAKHGANVASVSWANDKLLAIGGSTASDGNQVRVFGFDTSLQQLSLLSSVAHGASVNSVSWSPDNSFVAIGGQTGTGGHHARVYPWNSVTLTLGVPINPSTDNGAQVNTVAWAPDQSVLAIGGVTSPDNNQIHVYSFNGAALTLLPGGSKNVGVTVSSLAWSPNIQFLAIAEQNTTGNQYCSWNGSALTVLGITTQAHGAPVNAIAWSPNGQYVTIGGQTGTGNYQARVLQSNVTIPGCLIEGNIVSNVNGGTGGVGIYSYSLANLIIKNVLYNNDYNVGKLIQTIFPLYQQGYAGYPRIFDNVLFPPL